MIQGLPDVELWFVTGSQHLYGPGPLQEVATHSEEIAAALGESLPVPVVFKAVLTLPDEIRRFAQEASADPRCAGVILWNHTFSPAKMWIGGLSTLTKPVLHFHTQYNRDLPWESIDMDFMNLNQAAHGDREAGHLHTRLRLPRKVVVGHWTDPEAIARIDAWARVARAWADLQSLKVCRFGDNMRQVSVTDGDKVAAEIKLGFSTNGYGVGDLVAVVDTVTDAEVESLVATYRETYDLSSVTDEASVKDAARLEIGMRRFLEAGGFRAFTTTFEDLHGIAQLPGLACQRLMADGYGFGGEGDWKTAALVRFMKVVGADLEGGTSFMEDYTYHMDPARPQVLGSHMLEICPSIAKDKPRLEVHPLGIGGKADPARLVFDAPAGSALNASLIDLGTRFRLIVNEVEAVEVPAMPNLPVARALWETKPDFKTGLAAWILAGGAHHTGYSYAVTTEHLRDFAEMAGIELIVIDAKTELEEFKKELRWNDVYWHLAGLGRG
jgi:L-arabinose isomerase